jgi:carbonic anhydrase
MSEILSEVLYANSSYTSNFVDKTNLALPSGRQFTLSPAWMCALTPLNMPGLSKVTRMSFAAGGRASDDAIRSLVISYRPLGTKEFFVTPHTKCMELFANDVIR